STKVEDETTIQAIEARNVVHGLHLIEFIEDHLGPNGEPQYFTGLGLGSIGSTAQDIIADAIDHIRDVNDAVADLGMAESVYQVVQGNIDRAAGTLDTYSKGHFPQPPDVIQTPRSGVNLTHRVGLHIKPNANPEVVGYTPRAQAEPGLNLFLADILPALSTIFCTVDFYHAGLAMDVVDFEVNMAQLGLQPIDLLYLLDMESEQAMSSLDEQIIHYIRIRYPGGGNPANPPRPDAEIAISYFKKASGKVSLFELMPLIRHLRAMLLSARELRPGDVMLANEASQKKDQNLTLERKRMDLVKARIETEQANLNTFITQLQTSIDNDDEPTRIGTIDTRINGLISILAKLNPTGMAQTGFGFAYDWRKNQMTAILEKVETVVKRWEENLAEFDRIIDAYNDLPGDASEDVKISMLRRAEKLVSSTFIETPPADFDDFRDDIILKKTPMETKKGNLENYLTSNHQQLSSALSAAESLMIYD
ncbi:MAG: hypothetical protein KDE26_31070, partial [Bacteroidetes bacterium]|nr:hypothetical protein [Bacteroidota bacterium]